MSIVEELQNVRCEGIEELCWKAAAEIEQLTKQRNALFEAGRRSLSWLSSYPGGNAEGCYNQMRKAVDSLEFEKCQCDCNNADPTRCQNRLGGYKMIEPCECECHETTKNSRSCALCDAERPLDQLKEAPDLTDRISEGDGPHYVCRNGCVTEKGSD